MKQDYDIDLSVHKTTVNLSQYRPVLNLLASLFTAVFMLLLCAV